MKCFNCGKNFDYEKYYGICPKCGSFNKTETAREQHQRYHDAYDGGYQHSEHTFSGYEEQESVYEEPEVPSASVYVQPAAGEEKSSRGSTIFLIVSIVICLLVSWGGTALSGLYSESQVKKLQKEVVESVTEQKEHDLGESFSIQGMSLTVTEAWTLDEGWENNSNIPRNKKLVAVRIAGTSDGEWADKNRLEDAYIRYDGLCYWQIPTYEFDEYEEEYGVQLFDRYTLCGVEEGEGCLVFWVDEDEQEFTLCLEERREENPAFIQAIHSIQIHLEEGQMG